MKKIHKKITAYSMALCILGMNVTTVSAINCDVVTPNTVEKLYVQSEELRETEKPKTEVMDTGEFEEEAPETDEIEYEVVETDVMVTEVIDNDVAETDGSKEKEKQILKSKGKLHTKLPI